MRVGYARVSTGSQKLDRQIDTLNAAGCRRIFADKKSGNNDLRPELKACMAFINTGDTLVVPSPDRHSRSLKDLVSNLADLLGQNIGFISIHGSLDTTTPGGRLVFHVFAALAELVREIIVQNTNEGLAAARAGGRTGGRPAVINADLLHQARDLLPNPANSLDSIAKLLGVSVGTLYNHIPDLKELRSSRIPAQLEGTSA